MSADDLPFNADCDHLLQLLPMIDFYARYVCTRCGGLRSFPALELSNKRPEDLEAELLAEIGGTIGEPFSINPDFLGDDEEDEDAPAEPRSFEYPTGGIPYDTITLHRVHNTTDIAFIDFLDAWVDKGIADGTLTMEKAARYREAIAARCAELGEVPGVRGHLIRLDLKPGDILGVIAPFDNVSLMRQMADHLRLYLDRSGLAGVEIAVFPPGTKFRVLEGSAQLKAPTATWQDNVIDDWVSRGVLSRDQAIDALLADGEITPSMAAALREQPPRRDAAADQFANRLRGEQLQNFLQREVRFDAAHRQPPAGPGPTP
jgi:hypothetical protein